MYITHTIHVQSTAMPAEMHVHPPLRLSETAALEDQDADLDCCMPGCSLTGRHSSRHHLLTTTAAPPLSLQYTVPQEPPAAASARPASEAAAAEAPDRRG